MMSRIRFMGYNVLGALMLSNTAIASSVTIGPNGIDSAGLTLVGGLPLTGNGIGIGQVELSRPGRRVAAGGFDSAANSNTNINPEDVFVRTVGGAGIANMNVNNHAEQVAGVMISTDTTDPDGAGPMDAPTGVATGAELYSSAYDPMGPDFDAEAAITTQHIATRNGGDIRAINMSFVNQRPDVFSPNDGNQLLTQFIDWSATAHDVLYVVAAKNSFLPSLATIPTDNFNGMTIGSSSMVGGVYRQASSGNDYTQDAEGDRTTISLLAPSDGMSVAQLGNTVVTESGASLAAPHITGTVALLQQYGDNRIAAAAPRWGANARRHEVSKAVLMNSADKIIDDGTYTIPGDAQPAPVGTFLGMSRTVIDTAGDDWLQSEAFGDDPFNFPSAYLPLDDEIGAGHLNAKRALQQFQSGEYDSDAAAVPVVGWDYGHTSGTNDNNIYAFSQPLLGGSFISVTMAWDRGVTHNDTNSNGLYDVGEDFEPYTSFPPSPHADDVINDLDLYLVPAGMTIDDAIATSLSNDSTIEHLFFRIPTTGQYELWVNQWDSDLGNGQDYAIAWWAAAAATGTSQGDYDGNGTIEANDSDIWKANFGTANAAADGNGNGIVDAADYTIWRDHLGQMVGSGSLASVPEPSAVWLTIAGLLTCHIRRRPNAARAFARPLVFSSALDCGRALAPIVTLAGRRLYQPVELCDFRIALKLSLRSGGEGWLT